MKKLTKKQIGEFLGQKNDWSNQQVSKAVIVRCNEEIRFAWVAISGMSMELYEESYDAIYDFTEDYKNWLNGYETKKWLVDSIYSEMLEMIEDYRKEL